MYKIYLFVILSIGLILSCSDDKIIDDTNDNWFVIASTESPYPELLKIEYPSGNVVETNLYEEANGKKLTSAPEIIYEFGGLLFLLQPDDYKITVLDKRTYIESAVIDFSSESKKPLAVAFANATTSYVIFKGDSIVEAVDLTVMKPARTIELPGIASSIAVAVNQIYVACPELNIIQVIDTRDNQLTETIDVPEYPTLVTFTYDGLNAVVVSSGLGKYDSTEEKTEAYVSFIDRGTHTEIARQPLGIGIVDPKEQIPNAVATPSRLYAYIGTQEYFLRFNTRTAGSVARVANGNYSSVIYNAKRDEMILIKVDGTGKRLITTSPEQYEELLDIQLPAGVISILPI